MSERDPLRERDQRIAMLEQKLADYDARWTAASVALALAGVPDWEPEAGSDPKDGTNRILTVAERVERLAAQRDRLSRILHNVALSLRHAREYIVRASALDPLGMSSSTLLSDIDRALRGDE